MTKDTKILIAGDLCLQARTAHANLDKLVQTHEACKPIIAAADYAVVNLECAVVTSDTPKAIKKAGPALRCSEKVVDLAKALGFKACTLANNHFADFGDEGVQETLDVLKDRELDYVGAGINAVEARHILYKKINDATFAFVNACEHEFTVATDTKAGCNPLNPISLTYDIKEAKTKADYVIVIIHGGHEGYQLPSPRMQETYRFFVDMGADVVVNHHQHCYSGYELYYGKPIIYGLGNFSFDENGMRNDVWNEGYMVSFAFGKSITLELTPYVQNDDQMGIQLMKGKSEEEFQNRINQLNAVIADPMQLNEHWLSMSEQLEKEYMQIFQPYRYPRLLKLAKWHLLPKWLCEKLLPEYMTPNRKKYILNYIQCESHQDVIKILLQK